MVVVFGLSVMVICVSLAISKWLVAKFGKLWSGLRIMLAAVAIVVGMNGAMLCVQRYYDIGLPLRVDCWVLHDADHCELADKMAVMSYIEVEHVLHQKQKDWCRQPGEMAYWRSPMPSQMKHRVRWYVIASLRDGCFNGHHWTSEEINKVTLSD